MCRGGTPALRTPLPPLAQAGEAPPTQRRAQTPTQVSARRPRLRGAGSRLTALPSRRGTTPQRGGTYPRCDLLPPPLRGDQPLPVPANQQLRLSRRTHPTGSLGAAPRTAGQAPATGCRGQPAAETAAQSQCPVPKGPQGTRSRDREEKTELRRRVRPRGAGRHLLRGRMGHSSLGVLGTPVPKLSCPSHLSLLPKTQGHGGHMRGEGTRPSHPQGRARGPGRGLASCHLPTAV